MVPLVVDEHHLASANALTGLSRQAAFVVGPAVAGVLYAVAGASSVFALNAVSFVVAAGLMAMARPRSFQRDEPQGTLKEIADGLRYVLGVPWLWITIFLASFILMIAMAPYTALLPAFVEEQFDAASARTARFSRSNRSAWQSEALRSARRTQPGGASSSCTCSSPPMTSA